MPGVVGRSVENVVATRGTTNFHANHATHGCTCGRVHSANVIPCDRTRTRRMNTLERPVNAPSTVVSRLSRRREEKKGTLRSPFPAPWARTSRASRDQLSSSSNSTLCTRSHRNYPTSRHLYSPSYSHPLALSLSRACACADCRLSRSRDNAAVYCAL